MTKYRLTYDSVLSVGGTAITCATAVDISTSYSTVDSECEDSDGYISSVEGVKTATATISGELDSGTDDAQLTALEGGGTLIFTPVSGGTSWGGTLVPSGDIQQVSVGRSTLASFSASYRLNSPTRT